MAVGTLVVESRSPLFIFDQFPLLRLFTMESVNRRVTKVKGAFASKEAFIKAIEAKSDRENPNAERNP